MAGRFACHTAAYGEQQPEYSLVIVEFVEFSIIVAARRRYPELAVVAQQLFMQAKYLLTSCAEHSPNTFAHGL